MNVSLLDQNADYMAVRFIQDPNNVEDRQLMIYEKITDGYLAFCNRIKRQGRIGEDLVSHFEAFSLTLRLYGHRCLLESPGFCVLKHANRHLALPFGSKLKPLLRHEKKRQRTLWSGIGLPG